MQSVRSCGEKGESLPAVIIESAQEPSEPAMATDHRLGKSARLLCGRYQLEAVIGRGAMGMVYRAHDLRTGAPCAIKMLSQTQDEDAYQRFATEATVISQLFHPNIVEIREFRRDESGAPFLVMELLTGVDLHNYLQYHRSLPLDRTQEIVRQVASALHAIHSAGIVHRDVKAKNIFLSQKTGRDGALFEEVKLVDFGLSKIIGHPQQQTAVGIILGTPEYLAPEATHGRSSWVDARADQWSLAAVAYRMLSGRLPFEDPDGDVIKLLLNIRCLPTPSLHRFTPALPHYVVSSIERALCKNKQDRFPSILEFARAFCGHQTGLHPCEPRVPMIEVPLLVPRDSTGPRRVSTTRTEQTSPIEPSVLKELIQQSVDVPDRAAKGSAVTGKHSSSARRRWHWLGFVAVMLLGLIAASALLPRFRRTGIAMTIPSSGFLTERALPAPLPADPVANQSKEIESKAPMSTLPESLHPAIPKEAEHTVARVAMAHTVGRSSRPLRVTTTSELPVVSAPILERLSPQKRPAAPAVEGAKFNITTPLKPSSFQLVPTSTEDRLVPIIQSQPKLPSSAWQILNGERITASFQVCIRPDGLVASVKNPRPLAIIDEVVIKHIQANWRFVPGSTPRCFFQPFQFDPRSSE